MKITYYGHACFGIEINHQHLLFDPFISPNENASHINIDDIKADFILVSHGHEDHLADVESIAKRTGAKLISNFEIVSWFDKKGISNIHPMNHGGSWNFNFGSVKYVKAVHSSTLPDGSSGGEPGGFVIESTEGNFYFAGDTALTYDMKLIPLRTKLDFCLLPIGDNFTMGIDDACTAAQFVNCNNVVAMHFDTFGYIIVDKDKAINHFNKHNINLNFIAIGSTLEI